MPKTSNMKEHIIDCAQRLFNERGYNQVSLREIAEATGTTIGNLTYHFPHKEDLLVEIQDSFHRNSSDILIEPNSDADILSCLFHSFKNAQHRHMVTPFYYRHILELSMDSSIISKNNEEFRKRLYDYYLGLFYQARDGMIMRTDIPDKIYENLSYMLVLSLTTWIHVASPYYDKYLPTIKVSDGLFSSLYPFLTDIGKEQYKALNGPL